MADTQTVTFSADHVLIGRTPDRDRVYVDARITEHTGRTWQTTDHRTVDRVTRLSLQGKIIAPHEREPWSVGSISDIISEIKPANGWTSGSIARLHEIWSAWHANDLRAGCDHQTVVWALEPYRRPSLALTEPCPLTGYRYGSAWLVAELPAEIIAEVRAMFSTSGR